MMPIKDECLMGICGRHLYPFKNDYAKLSKILPNDVNPSVMHTSREYKYHTHKKALRAP